MKGFSLLELLITIALIALIAIIGIPNFSSAIARNELITQANEFVGAIQLARSEAVKRNRVIRIVPRETWADGYKVLNDKEVMKEWEAAELPMRSDAAFLSFNSNGATGGISTFMICNERNGLQIKVNAIGRPRITELNCY